MAQCVNQGDSIECNETSLTARKVIRAVAVKKEKIGLCFKFKAYFNSRAEIVKELNPKQFIYSKKSHLDLGDYLSAQCVEIFYTGKYSVGLISNFSSKHGIQNEIIKGYVYAHIFLPMRVILEKKIQA